jgi:hypothetical protein
VHGYPLLSAAVLEGLKDYNWSDPKQYLIGMHENCEVTTTEKNGEIVEAPKGRIAHQVYGSALNFNGDVDQNEISKKIGFELLQAEYQATVLAGWEMANKYPGRKGSGKLVLTALGGGVFANPVDLICKAVLSCARLIVKSGLKVYFVCFDDFTFTKFIDRLKPLVEQTHGRIIDGKDQL